FQAKLKDNDNKSDEIHTRVIQQQKQTRKISASSILKRQNSYEKNLKHKLEQLSSKHDNWLITDTIIKQQIIFEKHIQHLLNYYSSNECDELKQKILSEQKQFETSLHEKLDNLLSLSKDKNDTNNDCWNIIQTLLYKQKTFRYLLSNKYSNISEKNKTLIEMIPNQINCCHSRRLVEMKEDTPSLDSPLLVPTSSTLSKNSDEKLRDSMENKNDRSSFLQERQSSLWIGKERSRDRKHYQVRDVA
ncbi:unnamed protein product, partial [Didymodactylos carnosus]